MISSNKAKKSSGMAYYNEIDDACCAVILEQMTYNVIAPGKIDNRSIKEVTADDVRGFTQAHWFSGGALWSVAARLAGWPDDRPLWTASCPCQPFSGAGKRRAFLDDRHLWPDLFRIVRAARPPVLVGEQVASAPGYNWLDRVFADLEGEGYACRAVDIPACAVDAPHIRNRIYWVAVANSESLDGRTGLRQRDTRGNGLRQPSNGTCKINLADTELSERGSQIDFRGSCDTAQTHRWVQGAIELRERHSSSRDMEHGANFQRQCDADRHGTSGTRPNNTDAPGVGQADACLAGLAIGSIATDERRALRGEGATARPDNPRSFWRDSEWIACHDGKARRAKPGLRLLSPGISIPVGYVCSTGGQLFPNEEIVYKNGRVDLWRIAGNAIVPQLASEVLKALMDVLPAWR